MSKVIKSALELIGNTPLLQADRYAKKAGVKIGRASCRERV